MTQLRSGGAGDFGAAELICGELIGNAIRHSAGRVIIGLSWDADEPLLCVREDGQPFDLRPGLPDDPMCESGRGLYLINRLAKGFWIEALPGRGSRLCARLPISRL